MSDYLSGAQIKEYFHELNTSGIRYVLIKNIGGELPDRLVNGKDIDLVVRQEDRDDFESFQKKKNFISVLHPLGGAKAGSSCMDYRSTSSGRE